MCCFCAMPLCPTTSGSLIFHWLGIKSVLTRSLAQNQKVPSIYPFYRKLEPFDSKLHFELEPFDSKPAGKFYFKTNKLRHS